MERKEIMIVRNPCDTVFSYANKLIGDEDCDDLEMAAETAIVHWIHAWNYVVLNRDSASLLWLLYEELEGGNDEVEAQISTFLGIDRDFDLSVFRASPVVDQAERFREAGLERAFDTLARTVLHGEWVDHARRDVCAGVLYGYPLEDVIDFRRGGNGWKYIQNGFYPPELHGSWSRGEEALITFSTTTSTRGRYLLSLEIAWSLVINDEVPVIALFIDGRQIVEMEIPSVGDTGAGRDFSFVISDYSPSRSGVQLRLEIRNPRNPKMLGISGDDRDLGIMLKSLKFRPTP